MLLPVVTQTAAQGLAPGALWFDAQSSSAGPGSPRDLSLLLQPRPCYLERRELLWEWLEDVVAPLSWEKPLLQDSRLDMDPLGWDKKDAVVRKASTSR